MEDKENMVYARRTSAPSLIGAFLRRPLEALVSQNERRHGAVHAPVKRTQSMPLVVVAAPSKQNMPVNVQGNKPSVVLEHISEEQGEVAFKVQPEGTLSYRGSVVTPRSDLWLKLFHPYFEESVRLEVLKEQNILHDDLSCSKGMRAILVDWLAMLQRFMDQGVGSFRMAVRILDDVLDKCYVKPENLQVVALAALWIGSKLDGRQEIKASQLVSMSKHSYSRSLLFKTEIAIMKALHFRLPCDTPASMITYHVTKLDQADQIRHVAVMFLDVGLLCWDVSCARGSHVASAATLCALVLLDIPQACLTSHSKLGFSPCWCSLSEVDPAFVPLNIVRYICLKMFQLADQVLDSKTKFKGIRENHRHFILYKGRIPQALKLLENVHPLHLLDTL